MAAEVSIQGASLELGAVKPLFSVSFDTASYRYDVSADRQRFLAITEREESGVEPVTLVQNWAAGLRK